MRTSLRLSIGIAVMEALSAGVVLCQPAVPQATLLQQLADPDDSVRHRAVLSVLNGLFPSQRTAELDRALVNELTRLNEVRVARSESDRAGVPLKTDFPAEYHADLIRVVGESSDSKVIPALVGALGTGRLVQNALLKFGEAAVPDLLKVAGAKVGGITTGARGDTEPHIVSDAMVVLALILEESRAQLTAEERIYIAQVARERLTGKQEPEVIIGACRLAVASKDPALRARVERLVNNRAELAAMGIADSGWIDFVQSRARESLQRK